MNKITIGTEEQLSTKISWAESLGADEENQEDHMNRITRCRWGESRRSHELYN